MRTTEQTDVAYFWSENPYVHWNRNLTGLAVARGLDIRDTARLFAMVYTTTSDAAIAGFDAKYFYRTWRPRTAIPRATEDANPQTDPDPAWTPLLTVNHQEYPAGHAVASTAVTHAVAAFFGTDKVEWTIVTSKEAVPQLVQTTRTYPSLNALMGDVDNAGVGRPALPELNAGGRRAGQRGRQPRAAGPLPPSRLMPVLPLRGRR